MSYGTLYNADIYTTSFVNTNSLLIDIDQDPLLRQFDDIGAGIVTYANRFEAFPIRTYGNVTGGTENIQYS